MSIVGIKDIRRDVDAGREIGPVRYRERKAGVSFYERWICGVEV